MITDDHPMEVVTEVCPEFDPGSCRQKEVVGRSVSQSLPQVASVYYGNRKERTHGDETARGEI